MNNDNPKPKVYVDRSSDLFDAICDKSFNLDDMLSFISYVKMYPNYHQLINNHLSGLRSLMTSLIERTHESHELYYEQANYEDMLMNQALNEYACEVRKMLTHIIIEDDIKDLQQPKYEQLSLFDYE